MVNRVNIGAKGTKLDYDNWGVPMTDAVNDHETRIAELEASTATSSANNTDPSTSRTTTSTSFTSALSPANICGTTFVAPQSGKILVTWRAQLINSGLNYTAAGYAIRTGAVVGSGSVFQAADDARAISTTSTSGEGQGASEYVSGLTPGATYNIVMEHRVTAGTLTTLRRTVGIVPLIA